MTMDRIVHTAFFSFLVSSLPLGRAEGGGAGVLGIAEEEAFSTCSASRSRTLVAVVVCDFLLLPVDEEPSSM